MNQGLVDQIAAAVLYEGYILYPYRPSVKNRQRWTFGGLVPRAYSAVAGSERAVRNADANALSPAAPSARSRSRFASCNSWRGWWASSPIPSMNGPTKEQYLAQPWNYSRSVTKSFYTWQEAVEQKIDLGESSVGDLANRPARREFVLEAHRDRQPLCRPDGKFVGMHSFASADASKVWSRRVPRRSQPGVFKVTVKVENHTPADVALSAGRDEALMHGLVSTHTVLGVREGEFVSLIDPPAAVCTPRVASAATSAAGRSSSGTRGTRTRCCRRRSFSTIIPRSHPKAPASSLTAPRSTRSSPCGS